MDIDEVLVETPPPDPDSEAEEGEDDDSSVESVASYVAPIQHSVTLTRKKRGNAGANLKKEISRYKGEVEEEVDEADEGFWNQDFFKDDDNDSFNEDEVSDEDKVDKFDSDFNDSEEENEEVESEPEEEEEDGKRKNVYSDPGGTKKKAKKYKAQPIIGKKRPAPKTQGTGFNKGLTLGGLAMGNMDSATLLRVKEEREMQREAYMNGLGEQEAAAERPSSSKRPKPTTPTLGVGLTTRKSSTKGSLRDRTTLSKVMSDGTVKPSTSSPKSMSSPSKAKVKEKKERKPKHNITQEFLLTECVTKTEPGNKKWLLGRRRNTKDEKIGEVKSRNDLTNVAARFSSKSRLGIGGQGMYNTLTFPQVESVPEILKKKVTTADVMATIKPNVRKNLKCAVTGVKAKYFDPKTGLGYCDKESFKEIRRHYYNGDISTGGSSSAAPASSFSNGARSPRSPRSRARSRGKSVNL
ncbi:hypothetical protein TrVE_jg5633 [Triparma verrucosa]|uniref:Vps72/YL1 C-terminal domain-containing protein n=1 Tax=Triparma verrucosa TaxID=1606542 RepID=A0A9W7FE60_9STRA|nr:hypothetical protein TrVE_jg5633 [Triparma verrucosa]